MINWTIDFAEGSLEEKCAHSVDGTALTELCSFDLFAFLCQLRE